MGARANSDDCGLDIKRRTDRSVPERGDQFQAMIPPRRSLVPRLVSYLLLPIALSGCEPIVDIEGVYFPGWLASTVVGIVSAYGIVALLGRKPSTRKLSDSGLFFISLVVSIALIFWWVFFSRF